MFIEQPAVYLRWLYPKAYWRMDRHERSVYLTFDDGPIPEATPFILDTLKQFEARATFFMVGDNVRKYPDLYKRILAEGHQVGNHTHNHIQGLFHSIKQYSYNVWLSRKYKIVMWDLVTRDYSKWMTSEDIVNNVKRYVRNGSIITFHDSLKSIDKLKTALPESLQWLKEQGYNFRIFP